MMKRILCLLLTLMLTFVFFACDEDDKASDTTKDTTNSEVTTESTTDSGTISTDETTTPEVTTTPETTATPEVTTASETTATPEITTTPEETTTPEGTAPPVVVQRADTKTGISWDGVSPIIYTYPDGTTGTEIKVGATYESLPGMFITVTKYHLPADSSEPAKDLSLCDHCGRKGGDGSNGTCLRYWAGGDHTCKNCGTIVPVNTCHSCDG